MRILITGGAGFIGSALIRKLITQTPHTVLNVDKLTYAGSLESLSVVSDNPRYSFRRLDICDTNHLDSAFHDFRPDAVMHLAAESHVDRSIDAPSAFVDTNTSGTLRLLECARSFWSELDGPARSRFRFQHISTDEVFGSLGPDDAPFSETTRYDPRSPYSASKAAADHLVRAWGHTYGLPVLLTNCTNNYGPYHFPEKLIPLMIIKALKGETLPVYGRGENVRDWLYVDDHVNALTNVLERGSIGETYCIGGSQEYTNLQVVRMIAGLVDEMTSRLSDGRRRIELVRFVTDRPGHDFRYAMDSSKIQRELGWQPMHSFERGLGKTVEWYLTNQAWWSKLVRRYDGARLGITHPLPVST